MPRSYTSHVLMKKFLKFYEKEKFNFQLFHKSRTQFLITQENVDEKIHPVLFQWHVLLLLHYFTQLLGQESPSCNRISGKNFRIMSDN